MLTESSRTPEHGAAHAPLVSTILFPVFWRPVTALVEPAVSHDGAWWWNGSEWLPSYHRIRGHWYMRRPPIVVRRQQLSRLEHAVLWSLWMACVFGIVGLIGWLVVLAHTDFGTIGENGDAALWSTLTASGLLPLLPLLVSAVLAALATLATRAQIAAWDRRRDRVFIRMVAHAFGVLAGYWFLLLTLLIIRGYGI